jgi:hypothetical protein
LLRQNLPSNGENRRSIAISVKKLLKNNHPSSVLKWIVVTLLEEMMTIKESEQIKRTIFTLIMLIWMIY